MTNPIIPRTEGLWDMCNEIKQKLEYNQHQVNLNYHGGDRWTATECTVTVTLDQGPTFQWHIDGNFDPEEQETPE